MDIILETKDLTKTYKAGNNHINAVDHTSICVERGDFVTIVGKSGSGKTITAKAILHLLPQDLTASVTHLRVLGEDLLNLPEKERRIFLGKKIGFVPQNTVAYLHPLIKIKNQLTDGYRIHFQTSKKAAQERAKTLLDRVGIRDVNRVMESYPAQISGGMRQRVNIAMALMCEPQVIIADEPTTALDVTIQAQILELMKELQKKTHMGIIFITHNLGVVAEICDKVSVMYAGKIVEQGPVDDIFYKPGHPYTVGLLRSMPRVDAESYERLIPIEGTPVDMLNPPEGCPFAPRCEHAMKICLQEMPPYVELGEGHRSACWLRVQDQLDKAGQEKPVQDQEVSGRE